MKLRLIALSLIALVVGCVATGWVEVAPGEVVVVRRLGRVVPAPWTPGPHLGWPFGLERRVRVRTDEVRRLQVGLAGIAGPDVEPGSGEYMTGDLNLLRARSVVQYRVSDPVAFVTRSEAIEPILVRLSESSLARALARRGIDAALRLDRATIALDVASDLARSIADDRLGVTILGVSLTDARPPGEVAPDFAAAQAAQSERDRRVNEAKSYAATTLTAARSEARARIEHAHGQADRVVLIARSKADRFLALQAEAGRSRALTVRRLYLDALRDLWPRVKRKLVLTPDEPVDLSILGVEPP
jgi:modulator of FtsH protease HflK